MIQWTSQDIWKGSRIYSPNQVYKAIIYWRNQRPAYQTVATGAVLDETGTLIREGITFHIENLQADEPPAPLLVSFSTFSVSHRLVKS